MKYNRKVKLRAKKHAEFHRKKIAKSNPFEREERAAVEGRRKEKEMEKNQEQASSEDKVVSYRNMCRSEEAGKPLYIHLDTLTCCNSGCVACAYKIVVQPYLRELSGSSNQTCFHDNVRPELCLRTQHRKKMKSLTPGSDGEKIARISNESENAGLYTGAQTILVVGDGNLTFSLSLA